MKNRPQLLQITDLAVSKIREMIAARGKTTAGVRIGIRTKGCSGLSYTLEYSDSVDDKDEIITRDDVKILIDRKSILY